MAKVKFSALISEMRNKLNGSVFARNRGGAYLRNKVTPTNPQTIAQVQARSLLTSFSQSWRSLTEEQRAAWSSVVNQWARTDVFGDVVQPSGSALYIRLNINISLAGGSVLNTPPTPIGADALTDLSFTANSVDNEIILTFAPASVPADHSMYIEATPQLSPGISNANSQYRYIATLAEGAGTGADVYAEYVAKFGGLVTGQKMFIRAKFIRKNTGEVSQKLVATTIVSD